MLAEQSHGFDAADSGKTDEMCGTMMAHSRLSTAKQRRAD